MNKKEDLLRLVKTEIESLLEYFSFVGTVEDVVFDSEIERRLKRINDLAVLAPENRKELMNWCFKLSGKELDSSIIMRHARKKPLGYPGDFQLIDWIYTNNPRSQGKGLLWDRMFLRQPAIQAVRNREEFFLRTLYSFYKDRDTASVLSLACGSCREVIKAIGVCDSNGLNISFHFVDQDERAISYAKTLINENFSSTLKFKWDVSNVFRFRPRQKYSLIWASGLFDYLNDYLAIILLKRMWRWLDSGGRIVIGNFHPRNPNRNQMEWCLRWFLFHRTESEMAELCSKAGIPTNNLFFDHEPLRINIFLVINKI